jgi:hypothetical protein
MNTHGKIHTPVRLHFEVRLRFGPRLEWAIIKDVDTGRRLIVPYAKIAKYCEGASV